MTFPTQKELHETIKSKKEFFLNLAERWEDEKERESPEDYFEVAKKEIPSFLKGFVKNNKLNFEFACQEGKIHIKCLDGSKIEAFFYPQTTSKKEAEMAAKKTTPVVKKSAPAPTKPTKKAEKQPAPKVEKKPIKKDEKKPAPKVEKQPTKKDEKKPTEKVAKKTIASVIKDGLKKGLDKEKILENVKKEFPSSNTTPACVAWYKSKMKAEGEL